jgi:AraC family transcriptional regulator
MEMNQAGAKKSVQLEPRFENGRAMLVAGLRKHYTSEIMNDIPSQWQRFAAHFGSVPHQVGRVAYGICSNLVMSPFSFDYMSGAEVSRSGDFPSEFSTANIPALRYAIFRHDEHVSKLRDTIDAIWNRWLPNSGLAPLHGTPEMPYMMERYGEGFDMEKGMGDIELWIPMAS